MSRNDSNKKHKETRKGFLKIYEPYDATKVIPQPPPKWKTFIKGRCPRCRRGKVFPYSILSLSFHKMNTKCPHCDFRYEVEPGFFFGSMYLNYGFSILIAGITGAGISHLFSNPTPWHFLTGISIITFLCAPFIFRFSRIILLYFLTFVDFEPHRYYSDTHRHN